ncbi:aminoacyl-tRNA hydrolase [Janibacter melonis]|uniref:Peptidyl-tRNA hydrolase n=1 Tax=Janibacter melonis TaxID=262209 RepID=A0A650GE65_9MICO|nr:aminoacyl-tRNA hydrolase [Janibacter melonis]MBD5830944.1 aminoacyl-tRNA hydrolase [Janibacter melonis]QGX08708.1 aminoacyl-tRNA hydrolase [Janibacter melonis]
MCLRLRLVSEQTWLVVGLGNPGEKYAGNRHNVGAMVVEELARRAGTSLRAHKAGARAESTRLAPPGGGLGPRVVLGVPTAYMNVSGGPTKALASFFSADVDHLVVVHDELDIPFGEVRLKQGGGEGGHNGLRSITSSFGTKDYLRVRVGIGRPPGRMDPASFVLKDFSSTERPELPFLLDDAADAVELLVHRGLTDAQQVVHAPRP